MDMQIDNTKIALLIIKNKKLLIVRDENEDVFKTVGGKVEKGESDIECLKREVKEELSAELDPSSLKFVFDDKSPSFNDKTKFVHIKFYIGSLKSDYTPSSEIAEIKLIDSTFDPKLLTSRTRTVVNYLKQSNIID